MTPFSLFSFQVEVGHRDEASGSGGRDGWREAVPGRSAATMGAAATDRLSVPFLPPYSSTRSLQLPGGAPPSPASQAPASAGSGSAAP